MADSRRTRAVTTAPAEKGVSLVYTAVAALLALAGLAWALVYIFAAYDGTRLRWMYDLRAWNWLIGFGVMFLGLMALASRRSPLGRGRGVVWGMLACFLVGLTWIVVYYLTAQDGSLPVIRELGNYNLLVGIGFMATGFVYATKWE